MATKRVTHVLSDEEQIIAIAKRIKRAQGQLGAVARMLEEGEREIIDEALRALQAAVEGSDADVMRRAMEHVDAVTKPFAVRRMNHAIAEALAGRTIDDVDAKPALMQGGAS